MRQAAVRDSDDLEVDVVSVAVVFDRLKCAGDMERTRETMSFRMDRPRSKTKGHQEPLAVAGQVRNDIQELFSLSTHLQG